MLENMKDKKVAIYGCHLLKVAGDLDRAGAKVLCFIDRNEEYIGRYVENFASIVDGNGGGGEAL